MTKPDIHEIEARLREGESPSPPADLAQRLKEEIPERPRVVEFPPSSERKIRSRPAFLLAATIAVAVVGGLLTYRVSLDSPPAYSPAEVGAVRERSDLSAAASADAAAESVAKSVPEPSQNPRFEGPVAPKRESDFDDSARILAGKAARKPAAPGPVPGPSEADPVPESVMAPEAPQPKEMRNQYSNRSALRIQQGPNSVTARGAQPRVEETDSIVSVPGPSTGGTSEPNDQPFGDMFFKSHGVNPFIDTEDDRLSTFGLDVDTGSYTLARSYLDRGHLPPAEAIRVEEMVNFFDYADPGPSRGDFAIVVEGAPSPFADGPRYQLLRINVRAGEIEPADRKPATLVFVVDVSGSMNRENRLGLVKQSLGLLLDQLRPDDRVGLVIYGSHGEVLLEPSGDLESIRAAIERLRPQGSTNAEEGLVLAYELAERYRRDGTIHRVILCSDGVANVGRTGPESILARIGTGAHGGVELTAVGFGMGNYNDLLMEQLADRGDGSYAYVDSLDEARRVFVENLTGTLQTVAREAKVQVEFNPETVSRYRLLGYENRDIADERFRDDTVDAGEIGAGHSVTALYEIKLVQGARKKQDLATVRLRYHSVAADEVIETESTLRVRELASSWEDASSALRLASLVAEYAEVLRESYWARESDLSEVFDRAQRLAVEYPGDVEVAEFVTLVGKAKRLRDAREDRYGEE